VHSAAGFAILTSVQPLRRIYARFGPTPACYGKCLGLHWWRVDHDDKRDGLEELSAVNDAVERIQARAEEIPQH
jgi:hypothetical protein